MSLKLIKTAQRAHALGDTLTETTRIESILGEQLDEGIVNKIRAMNYDRLAKRSGEKADAAFDDMDSYSVYDKRRDPGAEEFARQADKMAARRAKAAKLRESGPTGEYALTPEQIVDQVCQLAQNSGVNCSYMSGKQFTQFARQFRIELEDHYDEVYSNQEWKQLVAGAWSNYVMNKDQGVQDVASQENEEQDSYRRGNDRDTAEAFARQRAAKRSQEDDMWATRHIKDPMKRAEALSHFEDEEVGGMSEAAILAKLARVVKSVRTPDQYDAAKNYANLVFNKINASIKNKQGFSGLGNSISLMNDIKADLHSLRKRLWPVNSGDFAGQENEEQGWPSDEAPEDDFRSAEAEMMNDPSFQDEYNQPWGDEDDVGLGDDELEPPFPGDEDTHGRFDRDLGQENEEHGMRQRDFMPPRDMRGSGSGPQGPFDEDERKARLAQAMRATDELWGSRRKPAPRQQVGENEEMSPERKGYEDGIAGRKPMSQDPDYLRGHGYGCQYCEKTGEEQEEDASPSLLKSLLNQRKAVSSKASAIMKKFEMEGGRAFHEHRMKGGKSPYHQQKQGVEHAAWLKGWTKAAQQYYNPEPVEEPKKKPAKKPVKKK